MSLADMYTYVCYMYSIKINQSDNQSVNQVIYLRYATAATMYVPPR